MLQIFHFPQNLDLSAHTWLSCLISYMIAMAARVLNKLNYIDFRISIEFNLLLVIIILNSGLK